MAGNRCLGLDYLHNNKVVTVTANQEVILCAVAIETPRILMLSGIGDAYQLQNLGIKAKVDLSGVGKNHHDHPSFR
jgi:choline dehydrogenase